MSSQTWRYGNFRLTRMTESNKSGQTESDKFKERELKECPLLFPTSKHNLDRPNISVIEIVNIASI